MSGQKTVQSLSPLALHEVNEPSAVTAKLVSGCNVCHTTTQINRCAKCKVVQYCGRDHQAADWSKHKRQCKIVSRARMQLERGSMNRTDMTDVLFRLAHTEVEVHTRLAIESALNHALKTAKDFKNVTFGILDIVLPCFMRLGRDQEAYDFMKWWVLVPDSLTGPPEKSYTTVKNEDVFEPVINFEFGFSSVPLTATLTLVKLRLLMNFHALQRSRGEMPDHFPQELLDRVRTYIGGSSVPQSILERENHQEIIAKLVFDVKRLYAIVDSVNPQFWHTLFNPTEDGVAEAMEESYFRCEYDRRVCLHHMYRAWIETPGAIDAIRPLSK